MQQPRGKELPTTPASWPAATKGVTRAFAASRMGSQQLSDKIWDDDIPGPSGSVREPRNVRSFIDLALKAYASQGEKRKILVAELKNEEMDAGDRALIERELNLLDGSKRKLHSKKLEEQQPPQASWGNVAKRAASSKKRT